MIVWGGAPRTPAGDIIRPQIVGELPALLTHQMLGPITSLCGLALRWLSGADGFLRGRHLEHRREIQSQHEQLDTYEYPSAPNARLFHTAIWTGNEMIVWGGTNFGSSFNSGGRYNPNTNSWTDTSIRMRLMAAQSHTAVWTGSEMIVWGGGNRPRANLNIGWRYNPATNTWRATSTASGLYNRSSHTAMWTGTEMIVWGGIIYTLDFADGARYNPVTDSWTGTQRIWTLCQVLAHGSLDWRSNDCLGWQGLLLL